MKQEDVIKTYYTLSPVKGLVTYVDYNGKMSLSFTVGIHLGKQGGFADITVANPLVDVGDEVEIGDILGTRQITENEIWRDLEG